METELTLKILTILTALICTKFFFVLFVSGVKRTRAPEDLNTFPILKTVTPNDTTKSESEESSYDGFDNEQRWTRIVQNDMENIPITLLLLWISVYTNENNETNVAFAINFFVARTIHTIGMIQTHYLFL